MTITKVQLAKRLREPGLSYRDASVYLDVLINAISEALTKGETVQLRGLGTFYVTKWAERKTSLNGEMTIPEHGKLIFRPSENLRMAVWDSVKTK